MNGRIPKEVGMKEQEGLDGWMGSECGYELEHERYPWEGMRM